MAFSASFSYKIIDKYSAVIRKMESRTAAFSKTVYRTGGRIDALGTRLGKVSTRLANLRTGFAAMMASRGLKGAIDSSIEFERAMNKVLAVTQASANQMQTLRGEARALGRTTKFSSVEAAQGMAILGQRGFDTAKILKTLPTILQMATAGDVELTEASDMLTGTMYAFAMSADHAQRIADVFSVTAVNTASDMTDLSRAMKNAAPLAKAAGVSFEESAALIGAMSNKAIRGSAAGTLLMNSFRNLVKPTREAIETLQKFGFKKDEVTNAKGQIVDMTRLLELFEERGIGVGEIFKIFQIRGAKAVAALDGQVPKIRELVDLYNTQTGAAERLAEIMQSGVVRSVTEARSAFEGMKEAIGKAMEPVTMSVLKAVKAVSTLVARNPALAKFVGWFLLLSTVLLSIITLVGVLAASLSGLAIFLGPILSAIGVGGVAAAGASLGGVLAPIGAMVPLLGAILLATLSLVALFASYKAFGAEAKASAKELPGILLTGLQNLFDKNAKEAWRIRSRKIKERWEAQQSLGAGMGGGGPLIHSPNQFNSPNNTVVEVVHKGGITVSDRSSGDVSVSPNGGPVPMNLQSASGYKMEGGY